MRRCQYGNTMRSIMTAPPIHDDRHLLGIPVFELDVESGVGTTTGQGSTPEIMLDWSNDGGRTFKPQQQWMTLGAQLEPIRRGPDGSGLGSAS